MTTELNIRINELREVIANFEGSEEDLLLLSQELKELEAQRELIKSLKKQ